MRLLPVLSWGRCSVAARVRGMPDGTYLKCLHITVAPTASEVVPMNTHVTHIGFSALGKQERISKLRGLGE